MGDLVGITLGHYRLVDRIGAGGMGVVYRARDERLERDVAVKVLPDEVAGDQARRSRFEREAKASARLDHPNILAIHDYGTDHGVPYVVMELLEGRTLRQVIANKRVPVTDAVAYGRAIANGLAAAHERGIIHRDLKPENVFLTRDGLVKILDFGLAKVTEPDPEPPQSMDTTQLETAPGRPVGTVAYMAPEQIEGDHVDHRSDLFALGVMLYELLTRRRPFGGRTTASTAAAILRDDPDPITIRAPDVSPALEQVVTRCLEKHPDDRFASAREMAFALEAVEPVAHRRRRRGGRMPRRRWPLALAAMTAAVVTAIAVGLLVRGSSAVPFHERDWLLITDFENHTGDPVFDHALDPAFAIAVEQSNRINVMSRQSVQPVLRQMRRAATDHIDEVLGREIARRRGVDFLLVPTISKVGARYVLTASIQDATTGATYGSRTVQADGTEALLDAVDTLSRQIRRDLGEALTSIMRRSEPLPEATTASLEALEQLGLGIGHHVRSDFAGARPFYEAALRIDPGFASAKIALGRLHLDNEGLLPDADPKSGRELLADAAAESGSLTLPERLRVMALNAIHVEQDLDRAEAVLRDFLTIYPDMPEAHQNLARVYEWIGRPDAARAEYENAIRCDPNLAISYNGLIWLLRQHFGDVNAIIHWANREIEIAPEQLWPQLNLSWAHLAKGDSGAALECAERALDIDDTYTWCHYHLGHALRASGRYREAAAAFDRVLELDPDDFWAHYQAGVALRQAGDEAAAQERFAAFKQAAEAVVAENPDYRAWRFVLDHVRIRLGEPPRTAITLEDLESDDPELNFALARLSALEGRHADAVDHLERTISGGFKDPVWVMIHPDLDSLHEDPDYIDLKRRALHLDGGDSDQPN
jgi:serine/threonine protein kinase/tetratricopeptide (TPR) repeat protein